MIFDKTHIWKIERGGKTQTRRLSRGVYKVGRNYSIQPGRGMKGIGKRIVIDEISSERCSSIGGGIIPISKEDAQAEGGYTQEQFERLFRKIYPGWDGFHRWAFKFHVAQWLKPKYSLMKKGDRVKYGESIGVLKSDAQYYFNEKEGWYAADIKWDNEEAVVKDMQVNLIGLEWMPKEV
jgi:hypothetical protein